MKHYEADMIVKVKIRICGLHYHSSDPFLFCGFFQQSLLKKFTIFYYTSITCTMEY